ncbi:MAG: heparan-alpha-glucosaminide N-acetyltransferase domain-containing protein [Bacteroidales bacterium]|nr:heparan-alpha-glucosaminide N-acetyltransferase domain-containing protein [Bacteroidales bacterium]
MKRILLPDLLKGLAAFFMVQIHITELFIDTAGRESAFGKTTLFLGGPFAAIVFMIVMGYFIAKNKSLASQNMLRGLKIFILGFLLNVGLNFHLLLRIKFDGWPYNPLEYLFGVDILYLAGMSIIILAGLKSLKKGQEWASLILLLAVISLTGFMNEKLMVTNHYFVLPFIAGTYSWSYFPLFPWLAYPLTGFIFAQHQEKIKLFFKMRKNISFIFIVVIAVLVLIFYKHGINTTINLPSYYHHTAGYALWALGLTLLWTLLLQLFLKLFPDTKMGNFFCWIGKNITLFYVIQWLIIGNIATAIYQSLPINSYIYWFGGIFAATVLFVFLIEKVKLILLRKF